MSNATPNPRIATIIIAYPVITALAALAINLLIFGITPLHIALPSQPVLASFIIATALLVANHSWLMTSTELTRLKYRIRTTPEEWANHSTTRSDIPSTGWQELERRHNAHRNTTENLLYFFPLATALCLASPSPLAAQIWIIGFALARIGHTACYLRGSDTGRSIAMTLSLLALYGLTTCLLAAVFHPTTLT